MKLVFCNKCSSVFSLSLKKEKSCDCGECKGKYIDELNAEFSGDGIPLGFVNYSFIGALLSQPESGLGNEFTAFVIPKICRTFKHLDNG